MFATKILRQAAAAERAPMIKFLGKRTTPASIDHTPKAHPASPYELPADFSKSSSPSFSSYRQKAIQHGPLGRQNTGSIGSISGQSLGSVKPAKGEYFDRNELPARFRRTPLDMSEIDAIETGGATLVC
ncbi:hypothetical protein HYFRA_00009587 [Hymenoscyphus fraxineus]|uniref:Uncharacterized protein n=1 Tax=Hymenoscyphus fraxineus TaxID=746836 RepID=A0A9N9KZX0_9HELO|nr:hypothetical protein HYFRA_00009587 [Hymenoscyphus fraxineus]